MFQEFVKLAKEVHNAGLSHDCLYDIVEYAKENNQLPKDKLFEQLNVIIENYKMGKVHENTM
jgi:hypothetical protein